MMLRTEDLCIENSPFWARIEEFFEQILVEVFVFYEMKLVI